MFIWGDESSLADLLFVLFQVAVVKIIEAGSMASAAPNNYKIWQTNGIPIVTN